MRLSAAIAIAALGLLLPGSGGATTTTPITVSRKHGHRFSTYTVSFKAQFASSKATQTNYVIGAVNSAAGDCRRGISSFGKVQAGPYKVGQTVRFVLRYPKAGFC